MTGRAACFGIAARHVTRVFEGGVAALRDVSLHAPAGALVTVVGPSGCGKTTLLRIMGGLDHATEGRVVALGADGADAPIAGVRVGFAFQEPRLLPWRSTIDNIALPLEVQGVPAAQRRAQAAELGVSVGLGDAFTRLPGQLSGGMRMRAAIARALITRPAVLLLDEPFGSLDEITRQALDDLLLAMWHTHGMTIVMVTHSVTEAVYLGQEVVVLAPGPGRVVHTVRPAWTDRTPGLRGTAAFAATAAEVLRALGKGMEDGALHAGGRAS